MVSRLRCLVVDDSPVIRKVARHIVTGLNWDVDEAETVRDALARCKAALPDVVLLDWRAHALLPALRPFRRVSSKPYVIYCMTENDDADRQRALAGGADDYLLKPFDRQSLTEKLRQHCAV